MEIVTGWRGFIGGQFINKFGGNGIDILDGVDISDDFINRPTETIYHFAAIPGVMESIKDPSHTWNTNVTKSFELLENARKHGVDKFIFASSCAAPIHPYGASKIAFENIMEAYLNTYDMKTCSLRLGNVYGPGSINKNSVVATMMKESILNGTITIEGDGLQTRNFIYVEDVIKAFKHAAETNMVGIWSVSGRPISIIDIASIISDLSGSAINYIKSRKDGGGVQRYVDNLPHWKPEIEIHDGLEKTWEYFKIQLFA